MPFKSKAQQGYMFANMPKTAKKWAEETPNMKNLPNKVKKEGVQGAQPLDNIQFWVVMKPHSHESNTQDIMAPCDPFQFCEMHNSGLAPDQVKGFYMDESEAMKVAEGLLMDMYKGAKALEEKKAEVSDKLQKTIDKLQREAESHMKMTKKDPENADKHHAKAEELMARIKDLRGKHKMVEGSKKELKELDLDGKNKEKTMKTEAVSKPIGKTKSGKDIYLDFNNPAHKDFTAADHDDASQALLTVKSKGTVSKNTVSPIKKKAAAQHFNASKAKQKK